MIETIQTLLRRMTPDGDYGMRITAPFTVEGMNRDPDDATMVVLHLSCHGNLGERITFSRRMDPTQEAAKVVASLLSGRLRNDAEFNEEGDFDIEVDPVLAWALQGEAGNAAYASRADLVRTRMANSFLETGNWVLPPLPPGITKIHSHINWGASPEGRRSRRRRREFHSTFVLAESEGRRVTWKGNGPMLRIEGTEIPETVRQLLIGRPVGAIIEHEALEGAGAITRFEDRSAFGTRETWVHLEGASMHAGHVPARR